MNNKVNLAIIGCGNRAKVYPWEISKRDDAVVRLLCDTDIKRAENLKRDQSIDSAMVTDKLDKVLQDDSVDGVIICTPDPTHCDIACAALGANKSVLLEKPMALNLDDSRRIMDAVSDSHGILGLAFVLRSAPFYSRLHELLASGTIGRVMGIEAVEHMGDQHGASYMRRWQRQSKLSGGLIANKCSHDLDILRWLIDAPVQKVVSFGSRSYFNADQIEGSPTHCSSCGCAETCRYRYAGLYVNPTDEMKENPSAYDLDLCVYTSDKDVVDNQFVLLEYQNGSRASFSVQMFHDKSDRTIHVTGTEGYVRGCFSENKLEVYNGKDIVTEDMNANAKGGGAHGGGDALLVQSFIESFRDGSEILASADYGLENTLTCIAVEQARLQGRVVELTELAL